MESAEEKKERRRLVAVATLRWHLGGMSLAKAVAYARDKTGRVVTGEGLRKAMNLGQAGPDFVDLAEALEGKGIDEIELKPIGRFTVKEERTSELTAAFASLRAAYVPEEKIDAIRAALPEFRAGKGWTAEQIAVATESVLGKAKKSPREAGSVADELDDEPSAPESGPKNRGKKK